MEYKVGDRVKYDSEICTVTKVIESQGKFKYRVQSDTWFDVVEDEMIEGLVEEECPQDFIEKYCKSCGTQRCDRTKEYLDGCPYYNAYRCKKQNNDMKDESSIDLTVKGEEVKERIEITIPEGYIFKDQAGNEIHALKIVLEKANTLKIQSNDMETETHRGYYTAEEETTNKSKKVAWFTFEDNDFADKVELDLSNRELIQEDGKWFVVKKKKEYPKTYFECAKLLNTYCGSIGGYNWKLLSCFQKLLICRNAYWKIAGEEMGLGKPWEPDWTNYNEYKFVIGVFENEIIKCYNTLAQFVLAFPTEEMRDAFYEAFREEIEFVKELL